MEQSKRRIKSIRRQNEKTKKFHLEQPNCIIFDPISCFLSVFHSLYAIMNHSIIHRTSSGDNKLCGFWCDFLYVLYSTHSISWGKICHLREKRELLQNGIVFHSNRIWRANRNWSAKKSLHFGSQKTLGKLNNYQNFREGRQTSGGVLPSTSETLSEPDRIWNDRICFDERVYSSSSYAYENSWKWFQMHITTCYNRKRQAHSVIKRLSR